MNTAHCFKCVSTWMGQIQRTHFTASYTLYNCVTKKKKKKYIYIYIYIIIFFFFFFFTDNGKMLKYLEKYR